MSSRLVARVFVATALLGALGGPPPAGAQQPEQSAVPVAAHDLPRGTVLEAGDFVFADADAPSGGPLGWITRRVVEQGEPLRHPTIAPADVIRSGDPVQLVWSDGALELRLSGRAMNSAAVGESVRVRVDTQRRFEGIALEAGIIRLDTPENGRQR